MTERDDQSIDNELSGVAMAALQEHESTVSANETEAALDAVRSRIAGGDLGGAPPSIPLTRTTGGRRSPWVRVGAVAAALSMIALGLVAVVGGGASTDIVTPGTVPQTLDPDVSESSVATAAPETSPTTTDGEDAPTTTVSDVATTDAVTPGPLPEFVEQTISVDAANPPPLVEPAVWQSVPIDADNVEQAVSVAVGADRVIVKQQGVQQVSILGPGPEMARTLAIAEDVDQIVAGPGPVFYGFGDPVFAEENPVAPQGFRFVAIATAGPDEGDVVAAVEVDPNRYLELPPDSFGEGQGGVIDRVREVGATIIGYVDELGGLLDLGAAADDLGLDFPPIVPRFDDVDGDGFADPGQRIVTPSNGRAWTLDIRRDPDNGSTFTGPSAPRPTSGDRVIYTERIGAVSGDDDFAPSVMPVVVILEPDGSGQWIRLPDDWEVVASDADGTILMRVTDTNFEFAFLDDVLAAAGIGEVPSTPSPVTTGLEPTTTTADVGNGLIQPTAIEYNCQTDVGCTQLAATESGRIVALDSTGPALRVYDQTGTELQSEIDITEAIDQPPSQPFLVAFLLAIGPDDVAYVQIYPTEFTDSQAELLAIPLVGSNAGSVVMRWDIDGSGDSSLIPRKTGLTSVGCCGPRVTRPEPDATIIRWVDRNGDVIESTAPSFDLNLGDAGSSLTRIDTGADGEPVFTRFPLPTAYQYPRDFPRVIATDDGGALAYDSVQLQSGSYEVIVDFSPVPTGEGLENGDVYYRDPVDLGFNGLLERSGTVVVAVPEEGGFARRALDEIATPGWPGEFATDRTDRGDGLGSTFAPGLNDHIDTEQPFWATVPGLFALQLKAGIGPNERVEIVYGEGGAPVITITTAGFLDDSVEGSRRVVTTELADDGLLRFVSGSYGVRCQPGRGHQDYSLELCV